MVSEAIKSVIWVGSARKDLKKFPKAVQRYVGQAMSDSAKKSYEQSSGNVIKDLGFPNPERELLKAHLTMQIYKLIKARGLTQKQAGKILGIKQPHVSALMNGRSGSFSMERLMEFLTALDQDVEISVRPASSGRAGQIHLKTHETA